MSECRVLVRVFGTLALAAGGLCDGVARSEDKMTTKHPIILVVAHRGASGYLPEHSEGAKVLAFAQGADVLEQDVVLSRDGCLVVSHDITMNETTNVSERFPDRSREDGRFYFADFDWAELRSLSLHERSLDNKKSPPRFPFRTDTRIMRLEDEIKLIRGLNKVLGKSVGFHIELKSPTWHLQQFGWHIGDKLMQVLTDYNISPASDLCFIQCFEPDELIYLRKELNCQLPLIQLLASQPLGLLADPQGKNHIDILKAELIEVAKYADGIGPAISLLVTSQAGSIHSTGIAEAAHEAGLVVHPYTVRKDMLPDWCDSIDDLHQVLLGKLKVDGFFTDFPDLGRIAVDKFFHASAAD